MKFNNSETRQEIIDRFLFIVAVAFIVHMVPVLLGADSADILLYKQQAYPVLKGLNIYEVTQNVFPYSPVSMLVPPLCAVISFRLNIPFYITMKIPCVLGDVFTAGILYLVFLKINRKNAYLWGLLYAVNPVSLLISSFHGNIMSIPTLFIFLSYAVLLYGAENNYRLSALLLGLAIGFRGFPVLLLPLFLVKLELPLVKRLEYLAYATLPTALSFVPFLLLNHKAVFKEVFAYSGWMDFGFGAILRAALSIQRNVLLYGLPGALHEGVLNVTKKLFLGWYVAVILLFGRKRLIDLIVICLLGFHFLYSGISSQYLIWVLPFAFLTRDKFLKFYMPICTMALLGFYYLYHPAILFGRFDAITLPLKGLLYNEAIWLTSLWLVSGAWTVRLMVLKRKDEIFV